MKFNFFVKDNFYIKSTKYVGNNFKIIVRKEQRRRLTQILLNARDLWMFVSVIR